MEKFENFITIRLLMQGKVRNLNKFIFSDYILSILFNSKKEVGSIIGKVINYLNNFK